jgi:5'-deoxynucleotidase YfbR-like HD superfamily hydrolase
MNAIALSYLFHRVGRLKRLIRSGWLRHNIPEPESVADHSFRTVFMAMVLGDILDVDSEKLLRMAVLHDLAEVMAGDITPHNGISREEKRKMEEEGLRKLLGDIPNANSYIKLWLEYEARKSKEAKILREIDKLEMAISAVEYQKMSPEEDLYEFIKEADSQIKSPEIRLLLKEVKTMNVL